MLIPHTWRFIRSGLAAIAATVTFAAAHGQSAPAGDVPQPTPTRRGPNLARPTPAAKKPPMQVFNPDKDARGEIDAAIKRAAADNRRVLVIWGDNGSPWSEVLFNTMLVPAVAHAVRFHYEPVWVDVGDSTIGPLNAALAQVYGVTPAPGAGAKEPPLLSVIESQGENAGKCIAVRTSKQIEDARKVRAGQRGYNPLRIEDFLVEQKPPAIVASQVAEKAQADAKARAVPAMLLFDEVVDGWCVRFREWLAQPEIASIFAKHFVVARIDLNRMEGAFDVYNRMGGEKAEASPWYVFVDGDGKRLAPPLEKPADGRPIDFGYPTGAEVARFVAMLRTVAPGMSDQEAGVIEGSLRPKEDQDEATEPGN